MCVLSSVFICFPPEEIFRSRVIGACPVTTDCIVAFFFFRLAFTFQLLDKLWSQVSSLLSPGTCLQFLSRIGFSIPTARRLSSNVANSCFRAFRESIWAQEKVPTNLYEYVLGGTRTHEIDLQQARG